MSAFLWLGKEGVIGCSRLHENASMARVCTRVVLPETRLTFLIFHVSFNFSPPLIICDNSIHSTHQQRLPQSLQRHCFCFLLVVLVSYELRSELRLAVSNANGASCKYNVKALPLISDLWSAEALARVLRSQEVFLVSKASSAHADTFRLCITKLSLLSRMDGAHCCSAHDSLAQLTFSKGR